MDIVSVTRPFAVGANWTVILCTCLGASENEPPPPTTVNGEAGDGPTTVTSAAAVPVSVIRMNLVSTCFTTPNAIERWPGAKCAKGARALRTP
jgi:hypothetical protein